MLTTNKLQLNQVIVTQGFFKHILQSCHSTNLTPLKSIAVKTKLSTHIDKLAAYAMKMISEKDPQERVLQYTGDQYI